MFENSRKALFSSLFYPVLTSFVFSSLVLATALISDRIDTTRRSNDAEMANRGSSLRIDASLLSSSCQYLFREEETLDYLSGDSGEASLLSQALTSFVSRSSRLIGASFYPLEGLGGVGSYQIGGLVSRETLFGLPEVNAFLLDESKDEMLLVRKEAISASYDFMAYPTEAGLLSLFKKGKTVEGEGLLVLDYDTVSLLDEILSYDADSGSDLLNLNVRQGSAVLRRPGEESSPPSGTAVTAAVRDGVYLEAVFSDREAIVSSSLIAIIVLVAFSILSTGYGLIAKRFTRLVFDPLEEINRRMSSFEES